MGTIPTIATAVAGTVATAAYLNSIKAANDFWALTPRAYVHQNAVTSIANSAATWTLIPWQAEVFDIVQAGDSPMHDTATNPSRIYIRTTGKYEINGQLQIVQNTAGYRAVQVRLNSAGSATGGTQLILNVEDASAAALVSMQIPAVEVALNDGDYIEAFAQQNSGTALNTIVGSGVSFLRVKLSGS